MEVRYAVYAKPLLMYQMTKAVMHCLTTH